LDPAAAGEHGGEEGVLLEEAGVEQVFLAGKEPIIMAAKFLMFPTKKPLMMKYRCLKTGLKDLRKFGIGYLRINRDNYENRNYA
jgi:hypothetical protein